MKIVISGIGIMGASLALAIKNSKINATIFGHDYADILKQAIDSDIIDKKINNWPNDCNDADVIFLATPIQTIKQHLKELNGIVGKNTVVTDIGSTKVEILEYCRYLRFSGIYIGSHPMTGAEKSGINAANPLLYENATYVLTENAAKLNAKVSELLLPVLEAIKARVFFLDCTTHDEVMSLISHLPQMIAVALMNCVGDQNKELQHCFQLSAGGFRDLTRIASSSPQIWQDIVSSNRKNIEFALDLFIKYLLDEKTNLSNIEKSFKLADSYRREIPKKGKGFLFPLTDVLVYVDDQIGVIAKISNALFAKDIDIRDIELLKIRENEGGVFMLSFENPQKAFHAVEILKSLKFKAFVKE
jgi:prephenate dehydrogenase